MIPFGLFRPLTLPLPQSSAGQGGLFGTLQQHKRGSEDYGEKRATDTAGTGMVGSWFNQTFKGHQKPAGDQGKDNKRGVME